MALLYARLTVALSGVSQRARLGSARPFAPADALRGSNSVLDGLSCLTHFRLGNGLGGRDGN